MALSATPSQLALPKGDETDLDEVDERLMAAVMTPGRFMKTAQNRGGQGNEPSVAAAGTAVAKDFDTERGSKLLRILDKA